MNLEAEAQSLGYLFNTTPFAHQLAEAVEHGQKTVRGILWEQGTGKTKEAIDQAVAYRRRGEIDGMVVVAPNGVHRNWDAEEFPKHMPSDQSFKWRSFHYRTSKANTKAHARECEALLNYDGFACLAMSYDAVMTDKGRDFLKKFFKKRKTYYVLDEAQYIKTPGSGRTKRLLATREYADIRRIMTGTLIDDKPFDAYAPICFLDKDAWRHLGIRTFASFKSYFGFFITQTTKDGRSYPQLVEYRNLHKLKEVIDKYCSRVTKDEVLDLPPKLYSKQFFDMSPQQWALYNQLKEEFILDWNDGLLTAPLAVVRMLRLEQITCGYLPTEDGSDALQDIAGTNTRLNSLVRFCEDVEHKMIIFTRYTRDVELILGKLGDEAVRYDGRVSDEQAADAIEQFQQGDAKFFVANEAKAHTGLTLTAARTVGYYTPSVRLGHRLQSEDRPHRIGQEHPVHYVDWVATGTLNEKRLQLLRNKKEIADFITGDEIKDWI